MEPRFARLLIGTLWVALAVVIAYWLVWFLGGRAWLASLDTPAYDVFENAFPAADAWLAVTFAGSAWTVARRRPVAVWWLIACGSASLYLALMDILFDVENAVYVTGAPGAVATELAINVASLAIGVWTSWFGWHHRDWFLRRP